MKSAWFIYHYKDGIYWLLGDLSIKHKKVSWTGFHPFIFTDSEEVNLAADLVRQVMPDDEIYVGDLSLLSDFIQCNAKLDFSEEVL